MSDFNKYTQPIVDEARKRGITVQKIPPLSGAFAMLEYHGHREFVLKSLTSHTGSVQSKVVNNKGAAMHLLDQFGYPTPDTLIVRKTREAIPFLEKHGKVVTKPSDRAAGIGVTVGITNRKALKKGLARAKKRTGIRKKWVLVQEHVEGRDYRVTVVNKQVVFGIERRPPLVTGNGRYTIKELVLMWNAGLSVEEKHRTISFGKRVVKYLARYGRTPESVPDDGEEVHLRGVANSSQGGTSTDVTDELHPDVVEMARAIARDFDMNYMGCDFTSPDIRETPGKLIELNPDAGLTIHENPTFGKSRHVAGAIVDMLFPETAD